MRHENSRSHFGAREAMLRRRGGLCLTATLQRRAVGALGRLPRAPAATTAGERTSSEALHADWTAHHEIAAAICLHGVGPVLRRPRAMRRRRLARHATPRRTIARRRPQPPICSYASDSVVAEALASMMVERAQWNRR